MVRYSLWDVSKAYAKGFIQFLADNDIEDGISNVFDLFVYAINFIYYNKNVVNNYLIEVYGVKCVLFLKGIKGVPKGILSEKSKKEIVDCSKIYTLVAIQYYSERVDDTVCGV